MTEQDSAGAAPAATGKKDKAPPPNLVIPPKKPKLTKAERRALQEAQRAAKAGKAGGGGEGGGSKPKPQPQGNSQGEGQPLKQQNQQPSKQDNSKSGGEAGYGNDGESGGRGGGTIRDQDSGNNDKAIELFSHLPPYRGPSTTSAYLPGDLMGCVISITFVSNFLSNSFSFLYFRSIHCNTERISTSRTATSSRSGIGT